MTRAVGIGSFSPVPFPLALLLVFLVRVETAMQRTPLVDDLVRRIDRRRMHGRHSAGAALVARLLRARIRHVAVNPHGAPSFRAARPAASAAGKQGSGRAMRYIRGSAAGPSQAWAD